jgi:hypothetical protein
MSILKMTYQADNYKPNSTLYEITVTVDEEVNNGNINTILPNNGLRFKEVSGIGYIPSNTNFLIVRTEAAGCSRQYDGSRRTGKNENCRSGSFQADPLYIRL